MYLGGPYLDAQSEIGLKTKGMPWKPLFNWYHEQNALFQFTFCVNCIFAMHNFEKEIKNIKNPVVTKNSIVIFVFSFVFYWRSADILLFLLCFITHEKMVPWSWNLDGSCNWWISFETIIKLCHIRQNYIVLGDYIFCLFYSIV